MAQKRATRKPKTPATTGRVVRERAAAYAPAAPRISQRKIAPRLPRKVKTALADFQRRVLALFPGEISQLILFGSYARGDAAPGADVDVVVVVKWDEARLPNGAYIAPLTEPHWQAIINAATDSMVVSGLEVAPIVVSEKRFQSGFALANRVKREGVILWPGRS
jgi:predicted nucleotidyltransferase